MFSTMVHKESGERLKITSHHMTLSQMIKCATPEKVDKSRGIVTLMDETLVNINPIIFSKKNYMLFIITEKMRFIFFTITCCLS